MTSFKKVYIKAYTRLNVGDDLFVFLLCSRYPNVHFYIKEALGYTDVFNSINNLSIIKDANNISVDAIVYIGGSIFIENSPKSLLRLHDLKEEIIKENIPTYIIGANFGPYLSNEYYSTVKNDLLSKTASTTFRDKFSFNMFKDLANVHYAADIVFSLDTANIRSAEKKEIGISLIHHLERETLKKNYDNYLRKLAEISKYYIAEGYSVRLFSFCEYEKDMVAINDLCSLMTNNELEHITVSNYTGNIYMFLEDIANLKLFITSRFHSMILGLKFNVPIIPICYSQKCSNVLNDMDFPKENIYSFDTLNNLNYKKIPDVFCSPLFETALNHFNDLDIFLKEN